MGIDILFKILIVLLAYLIGSIPTAYVLFKIKKGDDIRKYGSGNVGGTNIIRTIGTSWGVLTILVDAIKGFLPILLSYLAYPSDLFLVAVVSVGAVMGHIFPIYIRFRGGKAIATSLGVVIGTRFADGFDYDSSDDIYTEIKSINRFYENCEPGEFWGKNLYENGFINEDIYAEYDIDVSTKNPEKPILLSSDNYFRQKVKT